MKNKSWQWALTSSTLMELTIYLLTQSKISSEVFMIVYVSHSQKQFRRESYFPVFMTLNVLIVEWNPCDTMWKHYFSIWMEAYERKWPNSWNINIWRRIPEIKFPWLEIDYFKVLLILFLLQGHFWTDSALCGFIV